MELRRNGADKTQEILGFRGRYMEKKTSKERTGSYKCLRMNILQVVA